MQNGQNLIWLGATGCGKTGLATSFLIHAMDQGGRLTVSSTAREGGVVEIAVADTGSGIPQAIQPTIFEPFFTTKPEGKGTGLGLSTVLMVVERHNGKIDFTTRPGEGTTFRIHLPAVPR